MAIRTPASPTRSTVHRQSYAVVLIKKPKAGKTITKFKLRYSRYLYTFKTDKKEVAKRLTEALSSNKIENREVKGKKVPKKKAAEKK